MTGESATPTVVSPQEEEGLAAEPTPPRCGEGARLGAVSPEFRREPQARPYHEMQAVALDELPPWLTALVEAGVWKVIVRSDRSAENGTSEAEPVATVAERTTATPTAPTEPREKEERRRFDVRVNARIVGGLPHRGSATSPRGDENPEQAVPTRGRW
jgi:hypothetical protein